METLQLHPTIARIREYEFSTYAVLYNQKTELRLSDYGLTYEKVLGIAYLRSKYMEVHRTGLSLLVSVDGRQRSGKSIAVSLFARIFDSKFWGERYTRILYTADQIMKTFIYLAEHNIKGAVIMVDEAASAAASTDWYDSTVQAIVKVLSTYGYLKPIIFFLAPVKEGITKGIRRLFHTYINVKRYSTQESVLFPYELEWNSLMGESGKMLHPKPTIRMFGDVITVGAIKIRHPPKEHLETYQEFEKVQKKDVIVNAQYSKKKKEPKKVGVDKFDMEADISEIITNSEKYYSRKTTTDGIKFDWKKIKTLMRRPQDYSSVIADMAAERLMEKRRGKKNELPLAP